MPIPLIFGIGAAAAAALGVGAGVKGGLKMKEANDSIKASEARNKRNIEQMEKRQGPAQQALESLGRSEKEIEKSFGEFANVFEKIKNRPKFSESEDEKFKCPECDLAKLKDTSIAAETFIGSAGGIGAGVAGGADASSGLFALVAAAGTTTGGTAIAGLSGAAATNATLAWIGGGSLAAGGGGMALGSALLTGATAGVGLLAAGIIFNVTGSKLEDKAANIRRQVDKAEEQINKIIYFLEDLKKAALEYDAILLQVDSRYKDHLTRLRTVVIDNGKDDYMQFSAAEKLLLKNTVLLVGLLYEMCKVKLVNQADSEEEVGTVNNSEIWEKRKKANEFLSTLN